MRSSTRCASAAAVLFALAGSAFSQVVIEEGQTLTQQDIFNGVFLDQEFVLGINTVFEINGGVLARLRNNSSTVPFNLGGSTINLNSGSMIGGSILSYVNLNIFGGSITNGGLDLRAGSTFNMYGGEISNPLRLTEGAVAQISGGRVNGSVFVGPSSSLDVSGDAIINSLRVLDQATVSGGIISNIDLDAGSTVVISGGRQGRGFEAFENSTLSLVGGEFLLNGTAVSSLNAGLQSGDILTGTYQDGSSFIFAYDSGDRIAAGTTMLDSVALAPIDTTPMSYTTGPVDLGGLRAGQSLTLSGDAMIGDHFAVVGAAMTVDGGSVRLGLELASSSLTVNGGSVFGFTAHQNSTVNIHAGDHSGFAAYSGSDVTFSGGTFASATIDNASSLTMHGGVSSRAISLNNGSSMMFTEGEIQDRITLDNASEASMSGGFAERVILENGSVFTMSGGAIYPAVSTGIFAQLGSTVNVSGGYIENGISIGSGSTLNISGGGASVTAGASTSLNISGADFRLNGQKISSLPISGLGQGDILTGVLQDGGSFVLSDEISSSIIDADINLIQTGAAPIDTTPMTIETGFIHKGLSAGQELTIGGDARVRTGFSVIDSTLNLDGGWVGRDLTLVNGVLNATGGITNDFNYALNGSVVTISDAARMGRTEFHNSTLELDGGSITSAFLYDSDAVVTEGLSSFDIALFEGSSLTMTGGDVGINALENSAVSISGGIASLRGDSHDVTVTGGLVSVRLFDGEINASGGTLSSNGTGGTVNAFAGTQFGGFSTEGELNTYEGTSGIRLEAERDGTVNIHGGEFDQGRVERHGTLNLFGGHLNEGFRNFSDGAINIEGGTFGRLFDADEGSTTTIKGAEFRLNGSSITTLPAMLSETDTLTGTLSDASVFAISGNLGHELDGLLVLERVTLAAPDTTQMIVDTGTVSRKGLRPGQSLTLRGDASIESHFTAANAAITLESGTIGDAATLSESYLAVSGGAVGDDLIAIERSTVALIGGQIGDDFTLDDSVLILNNGGIGFGFQARNNSTVQINGGSISGDFTSQGSTLLVNGGVFDRAISMNESSQLIVSGGEIRRGVYATSSSVHINGGTLRDELVTQDSTVVVSGGELQDRIRINPGTKAFFQGGRFLSDITVRYASLDISGGDFLRKVEADNSSSVNISGGTFSSFLADSFSEVVVSGGAFNSFSTRSNSTVRILGAEYMINGVAAADGLTTLAPDQILSGTLQDGSVIIFTNQGFDGFAAGTTTLESVDISPIDTTPIVESSGESTLKGLRAGQSLSLSGDARLRGNFAAVSASIEISGGFVRSGLQTLDSRLHISGGEIDGNVTVFRGSELTVSGGSIGPTLRVLGQSDVTITGGVFNDLSIDQTQGVVVSGGDFARDLEFANGASGSISGGQFRGFFQVFNGSDVAISGGSFGDGSRTDQERRVWVAGASQLNLQVSSLEIGGTAIALDLFETLVLDQRDGSLLKAVLADNSVFEVFLTSSPFSGFPDLISEDSTLSVTLVPAPSAIPLLTLAGLVTTLRRRA